METGTEGVMFIENTQWQQYIFQMKNPWNTICHKNLMSSGFSKSIQHLRSAILENKQRLEQVTENKFINH